MERNARAGTPYELTPDSRLSKAPAKSRRARRDHVCGYCQGVAFGTAGTLKKHISAIHLKIKRSRGAK